ncbi:twin-arginine translocase subunit TatC [Pseudalkalibacillus berkeleyi]|uniref:Sec-independent protein translocase protein TatC n=1 Tax=Pseudalkalibacillus berkeleyi TaxID=1069813 RepID=A0ABS9H6W4_9BACL|nr:twin-arginine translocase subunit TatC [Pseudalkalibacillus berkeleyi]MCF6139535.1 twin-arginine translocase subunit TatC [Pseudalkalibacillus berkeleyi]
MTERQMTLQSHVEELRKRIFIVILIFLAAFISGFFLSMPLIQYLKQTPEAAGLELNVFKLTDPLTVFLDFAFLIGLLITSPVALYQIWAFISPGLLEKERRVTLMYIPLTFFLFVGGISFSYFILFPFVIDFMNGLSDLLGVEEEYGINEYFHFLFRLTLPFGILFQFPVVIMFLTRLGLVTPAFLRKIRKYSYFVLLVLAGMITPPELISHLMVTVPLILLYEISILIAGFAYKKAMKTAEEQEEDEEE